MDLRRTSTRAAVSAVVTASLVAVAAPASAHSLDSSTVSVHVSETSADATVSVALEAVDAALGTGSATATDVDTYASQVIAYLDDHLTVTGSDGTTWAEAWSSPVREAVEGIESYSATVTLEPAGAEPTAFTLAYDGVIEADPTHEAVVVLTDVTGEISTAGILTAGDSTLLIGGAAAYTGPLDMVGYGLHHVLGGADHLLFLFTLLLVAPVTAVAGRWKQGPGMLRAGRQVLAVASAFTLGHSLTLIGSALGWVASPSRPVEFLIAVSVGVAAVHAMRPLVRRGELLIALGFGLVHGLALAGILTDLGLEGATSVPALLAFNVGVELAQLATIACIFPSLYLVSRTRWYPHLRTGAALVAFGAATAWALDRIGLLGNPLAAVEGAVTGHLWMPVAALAVLALLAWSHGRHSRTRPDQDDQPAVSRLRTDAAVQQEHRGSHAQPAHSRRCLTPDPVKPPTDPWEPSMRSVRRKTAPVTAALTAAALLLSACGSDDSSTTATASASASSSAPAGGGPASQTFTAVDLDTEGENGADANTAEVVAAAEAFLATLDGDQRTAAALDFTDNASRQTWSNFPTTTVERKGIALADLSDEGKAAAEALVETMSSEQGATQIEQVRLSDEWLSQNSSSDTSSFGPDLYYIAVYGTPSATEPFTVQFGGHHLARNYTYKGDTASITPAFTGTEPKEFELDGTTYQPMQLEADTMVALFASLTGEQDTQAQLPEALDDILMGPGVDSGEFPEAAGVAVSDLSAEQQALVTAAMEAWVGDAADGVAASLMSTYTSQLDSTRLAYASTKTEDGETSYFRIDGPRVWIELINTSSRSTDSVHWHGVYRDKNDDYGSSNPSA